MFPLLEGAAGYPETEIYFACVRPECRKRGVLRQMLSRAPDSVVGGVMRLEVSRCNGDEGHDVLVDMWEKMGFAEDEYQPAPRETTCMHLVP